MVKDSSSLDVAFLTAKFFGGGVLNGRLFFYLAPFDVKLSTLSEIISNIQSFVKTRLF